MIPVYKPFLSDLEKINVIDCLESGWISSRGQYVEKFEKQLSKLVSNGSAYVGNTIAVANGTVALHLAMLALGIGKDDEVIVPSFTYIASSNCIEYVGATPVFADCNLSDWNISIEDVERLITPATKAVIAVHLYGIPSDLTKLRNLCDQHGIYLVEDCAESIGAYCRGSHCGQFGHISTFSFFGNKTITTGEGGAIFTHYDSIYKRAIRLKSQGLAEQREYWHDIIGYNFRMTNLSASIGCAQLERIESILEKKRWIDSMYRSKLDELPVIFQEIKPSVVSSAWMTAILTRSQDIRDCLRGFLYRAGIETRPTFYPIHTMPMYASKFRILPITDDIAVRGLNLPSYPELNEEDIELICNTIKTFFKQLDA
jgi:perosamine synthetase